MKITRTYLSLFLKTGVYELQFPSRTWPGSSTEVFRCGTSGSVYVDYREKHVFMYLFTDKEKYFLNNNVIITCVSLCPTP